jgi:hypothetical protein
VRMIITHCARRTSGRLGSGGGLLPTFGLPLSDERERDLLPLLELRLLSFLLVRSRASSFSFSFCAFRHFMCASSASLHLPLISVFKCL